MPARRGEKHHLAKLKTDDVREIRARYAAGGVSYIDLANEFDIEQSTIRLVVVRKTWRHV